MIDVFSLNERLLACIKANTFLRDTFPQASGGKERINLYTGVPQGQQEVPIPNIVVSPPGRPSTLDYDEVSHEGTQIDTGIFHATVLIVHSNIATLKAALKEMIAVIDQLGFSETGISVSTEQESFGMDLANRSNASISFDIRVN